MDVIKNACLNNKVQSERSTASGSREFLGIFWPKATYEEYFKEVLHPRNTRVFKGEVGAMLPLNPMWGMQIGCRELYNNDEDKVAKVSLLEDSDAGKSELFGKGQLDQTYASMSSACKGQTEASHARGAGLEQNPQAIPKRELTADEKKAAEDDEKKRRKLRKENSEVSNPSSSSSVVFLFRQWVSA